MGIQLHFTDQDWDRIERDWMAWWNHELDRPLVVIKYWPPLPYQGFASNFPLTTPVDEVIDHYQTFFEAMRWFGDAMPVWFPNFGPGIIAGFLGATVNSTADTVWFSPQDDRPLSDYRLAYDAENVWWRRIQDVTRAGVECWGNKMAVAHTDLGGNMDILAHLRETQRLLLDLYDAPEDVERVVGDITRLWIRDYGELYEIIRHNGRGTVPWTTLWSKERCYILQSDFSYMISPQMYERFVLPDIAACCDYLDQSFYHLDGKGQIPHLDLLLALRNLGGVQWVPGDGAPPPEKWLPLLKRIRDSGKLCQLYVSAQGAIEIVRELGGRGFAFEITQSMAEDEASDFLSTLRAEDADRKTWPTASLCQ